MAIPTGPYTLTAGAALTISPPFSQTQRFKACVLANLSAFLCSVELQDGPTVWLKPWSAHAYDLTDLEATVIVTPTQSIAPLFTAGTLSVDWIELDDPDPPTFTIGLYSPNVSQSAPLGEIVATDFNATGLPGATAGARFVGGTIDGPPGTGTFQPGDYVADQTGNLWICTAGGTPGTWISAAAPDFPAPVTSGSTIQSWTNPADGEVYVAKNGVNAGAWKKARDVLHASVYRGAQYNYPTAAATYQFNTVQRDPYGLFTPASYGYTLPIAGIWLFNWTMGFGASAAGQYLITYVVANGAARTTAGYSTGINGAFYWNASSTELGAAGDLWTISASASNALPSGQGFASQNFRCDYLGTG